MLAATREWAKHGLVPVGYQRASTRSLLRILVTRRTSARGRYPGGDTEAVRGARHGVAFARSGPFPERHLIHQDDRSLILLRQEQEPWDSGVMTRLSNDLRGELPGHESPVPHEPAVHAGVRGGVAAGRFNFPTARWEIAVGHLCTLLDQLRTPTSEAGTPTLMAGPAGFLKITLRQAYTSASGWRTKHIHRAIGRCGRRSGSGNCPGSVLFRFA